MRVHGFSRERLGQLNNWWTPSATGVGTDPKPLNRGLLTTRGGIRSRYLALVASGNLCRPKTLTLARTNRWHCPLGAHLSRHIRDAAGLGVGSGPVASRLALSWPDLLGAAAGPIKEATSHCLLWSSGSGAGSGVTSTICRSTRSITRRMVSSGMPPSASVTATFVGMSSPSSPASRPGSRAAFGPPAGGRAVLRAPDRLPAAGLGVISPGLERACRYYCYNSPYALLSMNWYFPFRVSISATHRRQAVRERTFRAQLSTRPSGGEGFANPSDNQ
jgi:hypothetical protein